MIKRTGVCLTVTWLLLVAGVSGAGTEDVRTEAEAALEPEEGRRDGRSAYPAAEYHHHEVIELTEPSGPAVGSPHEGYYHHTRLRPATHKAGPDTLTSLGIIAIIKLLIIKVKTLGLAVILLLKLPILLLLLLAKLLFAMKLFKLAKLALIPLFLPLLLPLLLGPLLLLPLLLPLLLLLPIPVLAQNQTAQQPAAGRRRRRRAVLSSSELPFLQTLRFVLESEQCIERIACQVASQRQPSLYSAFISWALDKMRIYIDHPKFENYVSSYDKARSSDKQANCMAYVCTNKALNIF